MRVRSLRACPLHADVGRLGSLLRWASWPPALQAAVHAIYPAIIVYQSAQRLRPTDGLEEASACADTYIPGPSHCTYARRVPASCVP